MENLTYSPYATQTYSHVDADRIVNTRHRVFLGNDLKAKFLKVFERALETLNVKSKKLTEDIEELFKNDEINIIFDESSLHPKYPHPFLDKENVITMDLRPFLKMKNDEIVGPRLTEIALQLIVALMIRRSQLGDSRRYLIGPTSAPIGWYANWFSNCLRKSIALNMTQTNVIKGIAAIFFILKMEGRYGLSDLFSQSGKFVLARRIVTATNILSDEAVMAVNAYTRACYDEIKNNVELRLSNMVNCIQKAITDDPVLPKITMSILPTALGTGYMGTDASITTKLAAEHPETFVALCLYVGSDSRQRKMDFYANGVRPTKLSVPSNYLFSLLGA